MAPASTSFLLCHDGFQGSYERERKAPGLWVPGEGALGSKCPQAWGREVVCMGFRVNAHISTLTASQGMKKGRHRYFLYVDQYRALGRGHAPEEETTLQRAQVTLSKSSTDDLVHCSPCQPQLPPVFSVDTGHTPVRSLLIWVFNQCIVR